MRSCLFLLIAMVPAVAAVAQNSPSDITSALAQNDLATPIGSYLGSVPRVTAAALGDLDGDGDLDAVVVHDNAPDAIYRGDGTGELVLDESTVLALDPGPSQDVKLADLDNDGLLDVVIVLGDGFNHHVYVHLNGQPELVRLSDLSPADPLVTNGGNSLGVDLSDLNEDGWVDVVVANMGEPNALYANLGLDGPPAFQRVPPDVLHRDVGDSHAVVVDDVNGDARPDIVISNLRDDDFVYLNRGEAEFDFIKTTLNPPQQGESGGQDVPDGLPSASGSALASGVAPAVGDNLPAWKDLGGGFGGGAAPILTGQAGSAEGAGFVLSLSNAAPQADVVLVVGLAARPVSFMGGLLLPSQDVIVSGLETDDSGQLHLASFVTPWSGYETPLVFQAIVVEAGMSTGHALSNGLRGMTW
jgi:hypothetical protein